MTRLSAILTAGSASVLLAACAGPQLGDPSGEFNTALTQGYVSLAASEQAEDDWRDTRHFTSKAVVASDDLAVEPDAIASRDLPPDIEPELVAARQELTGAFGRGAKDAVPADAADAQVMFDCWMQEQEENHQIDDIARCRLGFQEAMARIDDALAPAPAGPYNVFFDFDSADVQGGAASVLTTLIGQLDKAPGTRLKVIGHTDTAGAADYNLGLSKERAEAVAAYLAAQGVHAQTIETGYVGQSDLLVATPDGVRNAENRRVLILLEQ